MTVIVLHACKKLDIEPDILNTAGADISNFYKNLEKASGSMKRIAGEFKKREGRSPGFVAHYMGKYGGPLWPKGFKINTSKNLSRGEVEDSVFIIPVIQYSDTTVKSFIKAMLVGSDSVQIDTYTESDYSRLPFSTIPDSLQGAEKLAIKFMYLTNIVFGTDSFKITDKRLFHGSADYSDTSSSSRWVKLQVSDSTASARLGENTSNFMYHQLCVTVTTQIGTGQHCGTPDNASCIPRCDNCGDFCWSVGIYQSSTYCTGWWEEGGGSGGSSGGTSGTGTGGTAPQGGGGGWVPVNTQQNPIGGGVTSDSTVIEMLKKQMRNIKKQRDSVWALAYQHNWEYFFYLKKDADSVKAVGIKTDHQEHFVKPDKQQLFGLMPEGDYHTHQDNAPIDRHQQDPQDIRAGNMQYRNKLNFSSWVDCGDTIYVLVTQNTAAFENFIKTKNIAYEMNLFAASVMYNANRRQKGLQKLLELIGTVTTSGLGLYKTTDSNFNNFVKIN